MDVKNYVFARITEPSNDDYDNDVSDNCDNNFATLITFISHHAMDGYNNDKNQWTIKTLVGEAVHSDSPEATKEKGIQQHTGNSSGLQIQEKIFTSCVHKWGRISG